MHDYTLSPPYCTSSFSYLDTDCGSETWAYLLFISWNVMSMYIFLNSESADSSLWENHHLSLQSFTVFTGTVVENFSYVFQMGGKPKLSREQVRNFKLAWSLHDQKRSGYLPKKELVGFFNELGGSMELKVHPGNASVHSLKSRMMGVSNSRANSQASPTKARFGRGRAPMAKESDKGHFIWPPSPLSSPTEVVVDGLNISRLNKQLASLDYADIQRRKRRFEHIYYEAIILAERPSNAAKGGISFHEMLLLVAHYKLINDDEALCLEELVERRELQEKVEDRIQTEKVRGMLRLVWLRRRFLALRAEKMRISAELQQQQYQQQQQSDIPIINIDGSAASREIFASSSRAKPKLTLNLEGMGASMSIDSEPSTPPPRSGNSYIGSQSAQHLSPHRAIRTMPLSANGSDEEGDVRILLTPSEEGASQEGSISPSPSLREIERRASNAIESIDTSAWGALARRLSSETIPSGGQVEASNVYQHRQGSQSSSTNGWL